MQDKLVSVRQNFETELHIAQQNGDFDALYLKFFSKTNGIVTNLMKELPTLSLAEKKVLGMELNSLSQELKQKIEQEKTAYSDYKDNAAYKDQNYPESPVKTGMLHPTTQVIREMNDFFRYYGFSVVEGPEIETVEYNFRKLNLPEGHPATDLQDTLFVKEPEILLRTHTSSVESRYLSTHKPPIRAIVPGKVFRNETQNRTNSFFFYQYQGFVVDKGINIQNLKAMLTRFHQFLFGEDVVIRFRYKYYPEVSPGMGTDIQCRFCKGSGCAVCKYRGWVEVLGSGMIHYNTLKMCGIDPEIYSGFAFGMGLDRLVMQKYGVDDIRKLYGGEMIYL